jgi:4-alpha-glucanotransferase
VTAYASTARDLLGLGSEARMNTPGTTSSGNWAWRFE